MMCFYSINDLAIGVGGMFLLYILKWMKGKYSDPQEGDSQKMSILRKFLWYLGTGMLYFFYTVQNASISIFH